MAHRIGIIGFGNMGLVIGQRLKSQGDGYVLKVFDKDIKKTEQISDVFVACSNAFVAGESDAVVLAIKPQDFAGVLEEIRGEAGGKLIISIAAGITTAFLEKWLGGKAKVIRVMPNMPARIGRGISCLCKGKFATGDDLCFAEKLFKCLGDTLVLKEKLMNAATAISGSGPGFFYDLLLKESVDIRNTEDLKKFADDRFIPAMFEAAGANGFSREQARVLAQAVSAGSIALLETTRLYPQQLLAQIASKGGTTEAGLNVLHKGASLKEAVKAARKRGEQLSKQVIRETRQKNRLS